MAHFTPCMKIENFLGQILFFEVLNKKVPFSDFIQYMSQGPSTCLSKCMDKWNYLKNPSYKLKKYFCRGFLNP